MATTADRIEVSLGVNAEGVASTLGGVGESFGGLSKSLQAWRLEKTQEMRSSAFFVRYLEQIGVAGGEAGKAIGGMLGAFAVGGGVGVAIEGIRLLVELIRSGSSAANEEIDKFNKAAQQEFDETTKHIAHMRDVLSGKGETEKTYDRWVELQGELNQKLARQAEIQKYLYTDNGPKYEWKERAEELRIIQAEIPALQKLVEAKRTDATVDLEVADKKNAEQKHRHAEETARNRQRLMKEVAREGMTDEEKLEEERTQRLAQLAKNDAENRLRVQEAYLRKKDALWLKHYQEQKAEEARQAEEENRTYLAQQKVNLDAEKAEEKDAQDSTNRDMLAGARSASSMMAGLFVRGFQGGFDSIQKAFESMLATLAEQLMASAILGALTGGLGIAGGGGFGIGKLFGFEHGGMVPSAAGGWSSVTGSSRGVPAVLHPKEMVLDQKHASVIDRLAQQGGAGGNTFHVHALDARSLEEYLRRESRTFLKVWGDWQTDGRIS